MADTPFNIGPNSDFENNRNQVDFPSPIDIATPNNNFGTITNAEWAVGDPITDDVAAKALFMAEQKIMGTGNALTTGSALAISPNQIDISGRYPYQRIGFDNEELYAQGQGVASKAGHALVKMAGLAGTTFLNGTIGLLNGVGNWIADGKFSSFYDNDFSRALDRFNTNLENKYANYYTQAERDADWYSPTNLLSANFIFDKIIKNLGFAAGALGTGALYSSVVKGITSVAGLSAAGRLESALTASEKAVSIVDKAERFAAMSKTLADTAKSALGSYANMTKAQRLIVAGLSTTGEASMEALQGLNQFRKQAIDDFVVANLRQPNDQELVEINNLSDNVGNTIFALNTGILSATNYIQFPKILGSSYKAERNLIAQSAERIGVRDAEGKAVQGLARTAADQSYAVVGRGRLGGLLRKGGYFFNPTEASEEGLQYVASSGAENYFAKKHNKEDVNILNDLFGDGVENLLSTKEGIENLLIGGLSGALMSARGNIRENRQSNAYSANAVSAFNQAYLGSYLKSQVDASQRASVLQSEREEAVRRGDVLGAKNLEHDYMFNYVLPRVKFGRADLIKEDLNNYLQLAATDAGFLELKQSGIVGETDTKASFTQRLTAMSQLADDVNNMYQALTIKYGSFVDEKGQRVYSDEVIEKMTYAGSKISDYDRRLRDLSTSLLEHGINPDQAALTAMRFKERDRAEEDDVSITEGVVSIMRSIDELDVLEDTKDDLKRNYSDYFDIVLQRRELMDEYTDLKNNPDQHRDETPTEPTSAVTGTIKVKTADGEEELEVGTEYYLGRVVEYDKNGKEIVRFPKLTILGQNEDGTIRIRAANGTVRNISPEELQSYKLGKVSDTDANRKAKFYMNNVNTIFEFNFGKGQKQRGRIQFSPKKGKLEFVYKDNKGKLRTIEVTSDQFVAKKGFPQAMITPVGKLSNAAFESLEEFKEFKDDQRRAAKNQFKIKVISDALQERRNEAKKIDDRINSERSRLEEARIELTEVREKISTYTEDTALGTKNRTFRKQFRQLIDLADDLSKEINQIQDDIATLNGHKVDIDVQIADLADILADVDNLRDGEDMLEQLLDMRFDMEKLADESEKLLNYLGSALKSAQSTFDDIMDFIFGGKSAADYGITEQDLAELKEAGSAFEFLRANPLIFDRLRDALTRVDLLGDKLDQSQKLVSDIEEAIAKTSKEYEQASRQAEFYHNLFELFDRKAKEWAEEEAQRRLLEQSEEYKKLIFGEMKKSQDTSGDTGTGDPSLDRASYNAEGDRKKNITHFFTSGTDPKYEVKGLPDNDFHRRHQRFLDKLSKGNIKNPGQIRIIPITLNNQDSHDLNGWIKPTEKDAIRLVYARSEDTGLTFIDENGEFNDPGHFVEMVYSNLPTTELVDTGNRLRYNNKGNLSADQIKDMQSQWAESRKKLLAINTAEGTPAWSFAVSRGIEQTSDKENNVLETRVIDESLLDQPVISVSTTSVGDDPNNKMGVINIRPAGDIAGLEDSVRVPLGRPMLNVNAGLSFLNNGNLDNDKKKEIAGLLSYFVSEVGKRALAGQKEGLFGPVEVNGQSINILKYLQGVIYWGSPQEGKKAGRNQIWIADGKLHMGNQGISIPFTPKSIANNQAVIIGFLEGTYHNVNNHYLNQIEKGEQNEFYELGLNDAGQPFIKRTWKNYNHYLLSNKNPDGTKRNAPLTTRIIIPQGSDELQFIQRYPIVNMDDLAPKAREIKKVEPKQPTGVPADERNTITPGATELQGFIENWIESGYNKDLIAIKPGHAGSVIGNKLMVYAISAQDQIITGVKITGILDSATGKDLLPTFNTETIAKVQAVVEKAQIGQKYTGKPVTVSSPVTQTQTPPATITVAPAQAKDDLDSASDTVEESAFRLVSKKQDLGAGLYLKQEGDVVSEIEWFKKRFPNVPIKTVEYLLNAIGGAKAWGMFKNNAVTIYEDAEAGTVYHEAFEAVWNAFATLDEKKALIDEFRRREGTFKNFKGELIDFKNASFYDAKEQMAEEFRDWKLTGRQPIKARPKQGNFFVRLWNFIRDFIMNSRPADIAEVFGRIETGYYAEQVPKVFNRTAFREVKKAPESHIQDVLEDMTVSLFTDLFEKDEDIIVALEEDPKKSLDEIYRRLFNNMKEWFEGVSGIRAYFKGLRDAQNTQQGKDYYTNLYNDIRYGDGLEGRAFGWEFVKSNWGSYVKEHNKYLKKYGVDIETIDDISEEEEDNKNRVEYERDVLTISAKNAASRAIKIMFSTVADSEFANTTAGYVAKRDESSLKLTRQAQFAKLFNYVMHNISGRNTIYNMVRALNDLTNNKKIRQNANVKRILNRLKFSNFAGKNSSQMKLLMKFENVFAKFKPSFTAQRVDFSGNNYSINSNLNTKSEQLINTWVNNLRKSNYVTVKAGKSFISNIPGIGASNIQGQLLFLKAITGISLTEAQIKELPAGQVTAIKEAINGAQHAFKSVSNKALGTISPRSLGINKRLNDLAEVMIKNFSGNDVESQHTNIAGKPITNFVLHNYVSLTVSDLNDSANRTEFLSKNEHLKDIYSQDSQLLSPGGMVFNTDGTIKNIPQVVVPEGRLDDVTGKKTPVDKLSQGERILYEINENIAGRYYILIPADSKTEWSLDVGTYINSSDFFGNKGPQVQKFNSIMRRYLDNEIALAQDYNRRKDVAQLNAKIDGRPVGKSLRFFKDILPAKTVQAIHSEVIDKKRSLSTVVDSAIIDKAINDYISDLVKQQRTTLEKEKIIQPLDTVVEFYGVSKDWLQANLSKTSNFSTNEVDSILQYRTMNYVINNIEMHKVFFMDPAMYKDPTKRIKSFLSGREYSHVDPDGRNFNSWANTNLNKVGNVQLKPGMLGYHNFANSMKTYTLRDVFVVAKNIENIKKALGSKAAAYENINETDAQSLATLSAYREMLWKAGGKFTNIQEQQFQYEMAYERDKTLDKDSKNYPKELQTQDQEILAKGSPGAVFHTLKPIHSGVQYRDGIAIPSLDKTSMMPMFYRMIEGTQMEKLYKSMIANGVNYVRYESAHKVGIQNSAAVDLYNEDGTVADHKPSSYEYIQFKHFGIQVETSGVKDAQTRGTQLTKLATNNLMDNGQPIGKDEVRKAYIKSLVDEHTKVLSELADRGYRKVLSKLAITENEDGTYTYTDKQKVADFILDQISQRELAENLADGIKINPETGDFNIPLEALSNYRAIRNMLYSVIERNITRPKVSGAPKVQVSGALFEKNPRIVAKKDKNGKTFYVSNELAFYDIGEDGKTVACEILVPHWFRTKLAEKGIKRTDAELIEHLNRPENQHLLRGIGFRIPTQGLNSAEYFKIKEFLPQEFGDTVVVPSEITAKAGSDFDIDKLNLYLKNFYINAKGWPQAVEFSNIDTNNESELKDLYEKKYSRYIGKMRSIESTYASEQASGKLTASILEKMRDQELDLARKNNASEDEIAVIEEDYDDLIAEATERKEFKIPSLEEFIFENRGKSVYSLNSREAVENRYYEILEEIMSLPENFSQLITPNTADNIKDAAKYVLDLKNETVDPDALKYSNLLNPDWMAKERHKFIIGKGGVGIAAVSQTNIALNQQSGVTIKNTHVAFPHNTIGDEITVSSINNKGGITISDNNSGYINGFVDIAKGADVIDMGADLNVASTMMLMEKMGVPNDRKNGFWVSLFIAQPAVQEYLRTDNMVRSVSSMNPHIQAMYNSVQGGHKARLIALVRSQFNHNQNEDQESVIPKRFEYKSMESAARKYYRGEALTETEKLEQMKLLNHFLALNGLSWDYFRFIQGYNYDTSRFRDPNATYRKQLAYQKAVDTKQIDGTDKVLKSSFEGTVKNVVEKADAALSSIFKLHTGRAKQSVNTIVEETQTLRGLGREDREKLANSGEMSLLNFIIQTKGKIDNKQINEFISPLLLNDRAAAVQLEALKEQIGKTGSVGNRMIENLQTSIDKDPGRPSTIRMSERDTDTPTSNMLTASMRELKEDSTPITVGKTTKTVADIYRNIVIAQMIQAGASGGGSSFTHLIPVEDFAQYADVAIRNMSDANFDFFDQEKVFYRNNWNNADLVPEAKKKMVSEFEGGDPEFPTYYIPSFTTESVKEILRESGVENPNNYRILRLSGFDAGYAPVVKETVDRINPATGKLFTPQEKAIMRKNGDYSYKAVKLYKRVEINGAPVTHIRGKEQVERYIYKPINAWGDGFDLQEYYDYPRASVVSTNLKIQEMSDEQIVYALDRAGFDLNIPQRKIEESNSSDELTKEPKNAIDRLKDDGIIDTKCD